MGSFDLLTSNKTYSYHDINGLYAMGQVGRIVSDNYKDGVDANSPDTKQQYLYYFFNDQTLSNIYYTPDTGAPGTVHSQPPVSNAPHIDASGPWKRPLAFRFGRLNHPANANGIEPEPCRDVIEFDRKPRHRIPGCARLERDAVRE